jgi:hypothetical protein
MGKKDDAFVLKERGVVTTTIQGSSYNPGRLLYAGDGFEIKGKDYNTFNITFPAIESGVAYDMSDNPELYYYIKTVAKTASVIECSFTGGAARCKLVSHNPADGVIGAFKGDSFDGLYTYQFVVYGEDTENKYKFVLTATS